jgi:hypothetical protein
MAPRGRCVSSWGLTGKDPGYREASELRRPAPPEPWAGGVEASLRLIDELDRQIARVRA